MLGKLLVFLQGRFVGFLCPQGEFYHCGETNLVGCVANGGIKYSDSIGLFCGHSGRFFGGFGVFAVAADTLFLGFWWLKAIKLGISIDSDLSQS